MESQVDIVVITLMGCLVNNDAPIKVKISTTIVSMLTCLELCKVLHLIFTWPTEEYLYFGLDTKLIL